MTCSPTSFLVAALVACTSLAAEEQKDAKTPVIRAETWTLTADGKTIAQRDVDLLLATLFVDSTTQMALMKQMTSSQRATYAEWTKQAKDRALIAQRLMLVLAAGSLTYAPVTAESEPTEEKDDSGKEKGGTFPEIVEVKAKDTQTRTSASKVAPFPFSLAVAISHGGRILCRLKDPRKPGAMDFDALQLYRLIVQGNPGNMNDSWKDPFPRTAASHGWTGGASLLEAKYKFNLVAILAGNHHGVNLPYGGFGNPRPGRNTYTGPGGENLIYDPASGKDPALDDTVQQGHLYLCDVIVKNDEKTIASGLMFGIEPSAWGASTLFGAKHTVVSGMKGSKALPSVGGGPKMTLLFKDKTFNPKGFPPPEEYNGMFLEVPPPTWKRILKTMKAYEKLSPSDRFNLMKAILGKTPAEAKTEIDKLLAK